MAPGALWASSRAPAAPGWLLRNVDRALQEFTLQEYDVMCSQEYNYSLCGNALPQECKCAHFGICLSKNMKMLFLRSIFLRWQKSHSQEGNFTFLGTHIFLRSQFCTFLRSIFLRKSNCIPEKKSVPFLRSQFLMTHFSHSWVPYFWESRNTFLQRSIPQKVHLYSPENRDFIY